MIKLVLAFLKTKMGLGFLGVISALVAVVVMQQLRIGNLKDAHADYKKSVEVEGKLWYAEQLASQAERIHSANEREAKENVRVETKIKTVKEFIEKPVVRTVEVPAECADINPDVDSRLRLYIDEVNGLIRQGNSR